MRAFENCHRNGHDETCSHHTPKLTHTTSAIAMGNNGGKGRGRGDVCRVSRRAPILGGIMVGVANPQRQSPTSGGSQKKSTLKSCARWCAPLVPTCRLGAWMVALPAVSRARSARSRVLIATFTRRPQEERISRTLSGGESIDSFGVSGSGLSSRCNFEFKA
eukprot:scaffold3607_cov114-Isochrysis_galbana.AAC.23